VALVNRSETLDTGLSDDYFGDKSVAVCDSSNNNSVTVYCILCIAVSFRNIEAGLFQTSSYFP
jgi:hypothetical protein